MSRAYIYNMRNYRQDNHYGPFRPISVGVNRLPGMRVNWVHVQAIHHVMSIPMVPEIYFQKAEPQPGLDKSKSNEDPLNDLPFIRYPISLPYCQSVILEGTDLDDELDWAGVEGLWKHVLCYVDRHHLLSLNRLDTSSVARDRGSVNSPLEGSCFCDKFRTYAVNLYITGSEPDPNHPTRPRLHFQGNDVTGQLFVGWVDYTFDDQIRWYIAFGYNNPLEWSSSGVQVGAVRSPFGVLGGWAAAIHNVFPPIPIGPFWFYKVGDITRGESILNDDA